MTEPSSADAAPSAAGESPDTATPDAATHDAATVPAKKKRKLRWWWKTLIGVVSALVALALVATGLLIWSVRRAFPQEDGQLTLPGLSAPVTVYRDQYGIPQLYAKTSADLFRAQGYIHAQDRFWEMDFRRHITAGRLSELFGDSQVETDAFIRTLGWRRTAEQEWSLLSPEAQGYLEAYAAGVNAWLDQHGGASASGALSLEYTILGLTNSGYTVEPWNPVDTLAWLKAMAWDLRGNMSDEIDRAVLLGSGLSRDQIADLYPEYPYDRNRPIVDYVAPAPPQTPAPPPPADVMTAADVMSAAAPSLAGIQQAAAELPTLLGTNGSGIGSNSWAVSGVHTSTGKPFLANDPHLGPSMPGIWYQIGLHCTCDINVEGFSFSGVPGVIIGHNDRIAWGFTNLGPDVTDLYLEKIDGDRYYDGTQWTALTTRQEVIKVAGGDPVTITVRSTGHGPLLSDRSQDLLDIAARPPVDPSGAPLDTVDPSPTASLDAASPEVPEAAGQSPYGVALRWTALQPNRTAEAIFRLNKATDWDSFREGAQFFDVPAQNLLYADVNGNIGYQSPGLIPIRGAGDGTFPVPGWDPQYDWKGYIPFDELPSVLNPDEGFIVTANNAVVGPQYPYLLTKDWSYGFRSQRIADMITAAVNNAKPIDAEAIRQMQFDNLNGVAPTLIAALRRLPDQPSPAQSLYDWDFQQGADSAPAALFNVFYRNLLLDTFDELPDGRSLDANDKWWVVLGTLLDEPRSAWWDDQATSQVEDRDAILARALSDAVAELSHLQGDDPAKWRWGSLHRLELVNASFGTSGIGPIEWLFNRGPGDTAGGPSIVNATSWDPLEGYDVDWVPSMRMIVDLSNLDDSRWVQLTGNSGHAFHPNYDDQFDLWRKGENLPMRWDRDSIEAEAKHTLTLNP